MNELERVNFRAPLSPGDLQELQEVEKFLASGLPATGDLERRAWLNRNQHSQGVMNDLVSRIQFLVNARKISLAQLRSELLDRGVSEKRYREEVEADLLARDEDYARDKGYLLQLENLKSYADSLLWMLRSGFGKLPF